MSRTYYNASLASSSIGFQNVNNNNVLLIPSLAQNSQNYVLVLPTTKGTEQQLFAIESRLKTNSTFEN